MKVKSLLEILNLGNLFVRQNELDKQIKIPEIDWEDVFSRLNYHRKISKEYIDESIGKSVRKILRGGGVRQYSLFRGREVLYAA